MDITENTKERTKVINVMIKHQQTDQTITIKNIGTENLDERFSVPDRFLIMMSRMVITVYVMPLAIGMGGFMLRAVFFAACFFGVVLVMVSTISTFFTRSASAAAMMSAMMSMSHNRNRKTACQHQGSHCYNRSFLTFFQDFHWNYPPCECFII